MIETLEKKLVTSKQLSEIISMPEFTIRKLVREKVIPAYCISRKYYFDIEEVIEAIKQFRS